MAAIRTPVPLTPEDLAELRRIAARLLDQDERCTREVAFHVQRRVEVGPMVEGYGHDTHTVHVRQGEKLAEGDSADGRKIEAARAAGADVVDLEYGSIRLSDIETFTMDRGWETVQVCLTEEGAESYLKVNGHNLRRQGEPRIYGESFHRNREMIALRTALPALLAERDELLRRVAALTAPAPVFLYAIVSPSGRPHISEQCISEDNICGDLDDEVEHLNERCAEIGDPGRYRIVPLFLAPKAGG